MNLINLMDYDSNLFSGIVLPSGMDSEKMVNAILMEAATLTPVYSTPALFKQMISHYFSSRLQIHQKLYDTLNFEYDPISNYDRNETSSRSTTGSKTGHNTTSDVSTGSGSGSTTNDVSPYDMTTGYAADSRSSNTTQTTASNSGEENISASENGSDSFTSHVYGNIGVTTTQQMIESERAVSRFDIYREIAADFTRTFFITLY